MLVHHEKFEHSFGEWHSWCVLDMGLCHFHAKKYYSKVGCGTGSQTAHTFYHVLSEYTHKQIQPSEFYLLLTQSSSLPTG